MSLRFAAFFHSLFFLLCFEASIVYAEVFYAKDEAFKLAFPEADEIIPRSIVLTADQQNLVEQSAKVKLESKLFTFYEARRESKVISYAAIDTQVVRSMTVTYLVVLSVTGAVKKVVILAFHEPKEYMPPEAWLKQFDAATLSARLQPGQDVVGIAGSTLSVNAMAAGVRKVLALFKILEK